MSTRGLIPTGRLVSCATEAETEDCVRNGRKRAPRGHILLP